jgi:hypothetical protein
LRRRSDRIPAIAELKGVITRNLTQDHWLPGFNFNVEEWDAARQHYETLAICRTVALARAVFKVAIKEKPVE